MAAASALEQSGLNPDRLTVEVTEASVADEDAAADLQVMTRLGVQLTVDDVGTDWSVVDNSRDCVVNTVKIHGSLIAGLTDPGGQSRPVVESIVARCRSRGICTVAEAVETAEQVVVLRDIGAETAQGYFFSPPLTSSEAAELAVLIPRARFALSAPPLP
jgi:EAL domain-containing protein (putative c-di-GMP-specific phosphodiesterase class I)